MLRVGDGDGFRELIDNLISDFTMVELHLSMVELKLNHVGKRGPRVRMRHFIQISIPKEIVNILHFMRCFMIISCLNKGFVYSS